LILDCIAMGGVMPRSDLGFLPIVVNKTLVTV